MLSHICLIHFVHLPYTLLFWGTQQSLAGTWNQSHCKMSSQSVVGQEDPWRREKLPTPVFLGFSGGSDGKESACNAGDLGSVPGSGRSTGRGHGNPLQYSCLENPTNREAWQATVHAVAKSRIQLSD